MKQKLKDGWKNALLPNIEVHADNPLAPKGGRRKSKAVPFWQPAEKNTPTALDNEARGCAAECGTTLGYNVRGYPTLKALRLPGSNGCKCLWPTQPRWGWEWFF